MSPLREFRSLMTRFDEDIKIEEKSETLIKEKKRKNTKKKKVDEDN